MQSFLGDDKESRIVVLSDRAEATFRIIFADEKHEPMDIFMEEFIDEKSAKAKGKRVTTLEVTTIEDITPEPEPEPEVSPDESGETLEEEETMETTEESTQTTSIDIDGVPMTFEKPVDPQLDLF